jgi:hypothetical protein
MPRPPWAGTDPDAYLFGCPKIPYDSMSAANAALDRMREEGRGIDMESYLCRLCGKVHHGHTPSAVVDSTVTVSSNAVVQTTWRSETCHTTNVNQTLTSIQPQQPAPEQNVAIPSWKMAWLSRPGGPLDPERWGSY